MVFRGNQARVDGEPAGLDREVVIPAAILHAAHLDDAKPATLGAVFERELLQRDDAVRDAVQLEVVVVRRQIVEQHHGAPSTGKEILQGKNLPSIAQRVLRKQTHLGKRVEDDAFRIYLPHPVENAFGRLAELHLRRMEQRQLLIGIEARFRRHELKNVNAGQCPAVPGDDGAQFAFALRQGDVKAGLSLANPFQQKLERQGGLAGAWAPFDQIDAIGVEASAQDIVQPAAAG